MALRDTEDIKVIKVNEPLALRDKETFHSGPGDFDLGDQGEERTTYIHARVGEGKTKELVLIHLIPRSLVNLRLLSI